MGLIFCVLTIGLFKAENTSLTIATHEDYTAENLPVRSFTLVTVQPSLRLESCYGTNPSTADYCRTLLAGNRTIDLINMRSIGSGAVVGWAGDRTYILTAKHVCEGPIPPYDIQIEGEGENQFILGVSSTSSYTLVDYEGNERDAEIFRMHQHADICVLVTDGNWGTPIRVATEPPPEGAMVYNMAAPLGIFTPGMVPQWRGYYSGRDDRGYEFYSVPVAGGSSGSPVIYDNEIVSIIVMAPIGFSNIAIGVNLQDIHDVLGSIQ